jgi:hypothetical protein
MEYIFRSSGVKEGAIMRSVELLVVLRLASWHKSKWTYAELAQSLYLGEGQTHGAVKGAAQSGLILTRKPFSSEI